MIFDSLHIAASSLKAQQQAMGVVSNNIANVNTPGYSRQTADLATATPDRIGNLNFGRGVQLADIQRNIDPLLAQAQLVNGGKQGYWDAISTGLGAVEHVFGSLQNTGLVASLNDFFLAWQQLANHPADAAQKLNVRSKASTMAMQLNQMHQQLTAAQQSADDSINQAILEANQLLDRIASLSAQINRQERGGAAGAANDLRDQRDQALRDLSRIIPVQQVSHAKGSFLIQSMNGDLLLQDDAARHLARGAIGAGGFADIVIAETGQALGGLSSGGKLGGLVALRDQKLGGYLRGIDSIAANLAFAVNQLHASGAGGTPIGHLTAGQPADPAAPLDGPAQSAPFATQIRSGSFILHVYDATGTPTPPGGTAIHITAGATTMNDIAAQINAIAGVSATVDANGYLSIDAGGGSVAFSDDTSHFLAAYEINSFFHGGDAATIGLAAPISADAGRIHTGRIDTLSSTVQSGDNTLALDIFALQNTPLNVDGSGGASLHQRTALLSSQYGDDVATAQQQQQYRNAEAASLESRRQAISGVNLDEELVSMLKFQRAYEASAKVIATAERMLDSLLGLIQ